MIYQEALEFIHGIEVFGPKPGLKRITALLELMGNPQDKLQYVHVAGTNGKGSTCTMLSHILHSAGYKTGLYISPFVLDFRERMQINNKLIPKHELAEITEYVSQFWETLDSQEMAPSEFEVVFAVAVEYFKRSKCDIVVLEVGMGGRLDATNTIKTPLASVITSISLDHMQHLGNTLEEIAYEKCGIIKENGATICYPVQEVEVLGVVMESCSENNNQLYIPHNVDIHKSDFDGSDITYSDLDIHVPLAGEHQIYNAITVVETCNVLNKRGLALRDKSIISGIEKTKFPSRLEILSKSPFTILDGAHNISGATALGKALELLGGRNIHAVIGIMSDKDVDGFAEQIASRCKSIVVTSIPNMPRFTDINDLADIVSSYCDEVSVEVLPKMAYQKALEKCVGDDVLLLCGSLYLASELRKLVKGEYKDD